VLTHDLQRRLDPFLMLDAFGSDDAADYIAGFPNHPHRGFETVTYMIAGRMRHRDSAGHEGLLENGGVQWMCAGRGLVHSELPEQEEGRMEGFQLWLNLPSQDKMGPAWYRDIPSAAIPELRLPGVTVRVIAGAASGLAGAVQRPQTSPLYLDIHLAPGSAFEQALPLGHEGFVYVYRGSAEVGAGASATAVPRQRMAVLAHAHAGLEPEGAAADGVRICNPGAEEARLLLIAGQPLREPIVQHGPFVMNTREQIFQAVQDFQAGRLG
jgi:redox-sensitive bicupin YhaK (pirin superfamily)